jgi:hypothetical protein
MKLSRVFIIIRYVRKAWMIPEGGRREETDTSLFRKSSSLEMFSQPSFPPLPKHLPRRHEFLNSPRPRQSIAVHPAGLMRPPVSLRDAVRADHGQSALVLREFSAVERTIIFLRIMSPGHNGDRVPDSPFLRQNLDVELLSARGRAPKV